MPYLDYLKTLLRPLRLYDLDVGYGAQELALASERLDEVFFNLEATEAESFIISAEDIGLEAYEQILPYKPVFTNVKSRREAIAALLRIDGRSFTQKALSDTVRGCGVLATVKEAAAHQTVVVSFPGTKGIPDEFESLKSRIEQILPCHLGIEYYFAFITWAELEESFPIWRELDAAAFCWEELELFTPLVEDDFQ